VKRGEVVRLITYRWFRNPLHLPGGNSVIHAHAREVDGLEEAFALIVRDDVYVIAVRRGLLKPDDLALLDRLVQRGTESLMARPMLALTS
jgi:hypothetical protein